MKSVRVIGIVVLLGAGLSAAGYFAYSRLTAKDPAPTPAAKTDEAPAPALSGAEGTSPSPEQETDAPPAPAGEDPAAGGDALASKVLVQKPTPRQRRENAWYIHDPKIPGGSLKGVCYVPFDKDVRLYPPRPIEIEGANAIQEPAEGEQTYFEGRKPLPEPLLGRYAAKEKRYGVLGAAVMLHDVAAGSRGEFDAIRFQVDFRTQQIVPAKPRGMSESEIILNPSAHGVGVMQIKQLIQALNLTLFDCRLKLSDTATGQVVWEEPARKYHDPEFPGDHLGDNPVMARPNVLQIPRIDRKGVYELRCLRHPWQVSYLVLWDNPYVAVSTGDGDHQHRFPDRAGTFEITGIPEGTYTVEVWHPHFKPVKSTHTVEISADRTTPLMVEFEAPEPLKTPPPPLPETPITDWAFVGPFYPLMDEEPDSPNNALSFTATYEGMEENVTWKAIKADGPGAYVRLDQIMWRMAEPSLSYYAVTFDLPKPQRLTLLVHNEAEGLRMWLNGKSIFRSYTGDFNQGSRYGEPFIVTGELKAGANTMLMLVTARSTQNSRFNVRYLAEGVTVKTPAGIAN